MSRNLKKLMLAAMAVMMLGVIGAQAAQAAEFHSSVEKTTITSTPHGTGKSAHHVFDAAGGSITCGGTEASFHGTTSAKTVGSITITANYGPKTNCLFFGQQTLVNMNGCHYLFNANKTVDIVPATCAGITFTVPNPECTVTVPPQTGLTGVDYTNNAAKTEVTLDANVHSIKYNSTGSGCIVSGHGLTDGTYTTGNTWVTGTEDKEGGAMVSVWYE